MPLSNPDDSLLLIRCPTCGQRFKVADDLRGRTVECGACEQRFRINDEVIVRGKKFYPGERKNSQLNRFQRVPLAIAPEVGDILQMRYGKVPDPAEFEPAPPQRIIAGIVGVGGIVFMAMLLILGVNRGGALDGMAMENRLLMAGFGGLLGWVLLVYANPRARGMASVVSLMLSLGLLSLPFYFKMEDESHEDRVLALSARPQKTETMSVESRRIMDLRKLIGTDPLVLEINRLAREDDSKQAVGLWLKGLREQNRFLVRDYLLRVTGADFQSHYYARGGGNFLMVLTGLRKSLDEVAKHAAALGTLEMIYPEISVVEVRVNNESFVSGPIEQLTDKQDPSFYRLNKEELESIDLERVSRAVQRFAEAEPKIYRIDITRKLIELLGEQGVSFKGDICRALAVWSEQPGPAGKVALDQVKSLISRKAQVPLEMISLILKEKNMEVIPVLDELWFMSPTRWETLYGDVGPPAEAALIRRFPNTEGMFRQSVVRLLGRVGGKDSLPLLDGTMNGADSELKVLLAKSSASIRRRLGQ